MVFLHLENLFAGLLKRYMAYKTYHSYLVYDDGSIEDRYHRKKVPTKRQDGYTQVALTIRTPEGEKIREMHLVHRLVASLFVDNPYNLPYVHHIDGNKRNNKVSNLKWVDPCENAKCYIIDSGRSVQLMVDNKRYMSIREASEDTGVSRSKIYKYIDAGRDEQGRRWIKL